MHYGQDGSSAREAVRIRDQDRCANCRQSGDDVTLDTHHIVPRGQGGSDRLSNLILLCRRCHDAAHDEQMAPTVRFYSNGEMTDDEFSSYYQLMERLKELGFARFNDTEKCWYVPKADIAVLLEELIEG